MRVPLGPALFCGVYLAVQLILAARGPLYPNEQIRFAWRMFLHSPRVTRYEIGFRDGRIVELDQITLRPAVEFVGLQVNRLRFVPPHLRRGIPDAAWIRSHLPGAATPREFRCP